jgi:hypothetical protein
MNETVDPTTTLEPEPDARTYAVYQSVTPTTIYPMRRSLCFDDAYCEALHIVGMIQDDGGPVDGYPRVHIVSEPFIEWEWPTSEHVNEHLFPTHPPE